MTNDERYFALFEVLISYDVEAIEYKTINLLMTRIYQMASDEERLIIDSKE